MNLYYDISLNRKSCGRIYGNIFIHLYSALFTIKYALYEQIKV